jgi:hypothetical protein
MLCGFGCNEQFIAETKGRHYRQDCTMRFVSCDLNCGAEMRAHEHSYHINKQCQRR